MDNEIYVLLLILKIKYQYGVSKEDLLKIIEHAYDETSITKKEKQLLDKCYKRYRK